jgi:GPH family glycoside/pentoside/hexuronide:cation symporter
VIEVASRRQRETVAGTYVAVWSLGSKATQALALGVCLPLLGLFGFDPRIENGPDQIAALRYTIALLPSACYLGAILIISRYGISKARLDRLRLAFDRRESRRIHLLPQQ